MSRQACVIKRVHAVLRHLNETSFNYQSSHMVSTTHANNRGALHTIQGQLRTRNGRKRGGRRRLCAEGPGDSFLQPNNLLELTSHFGLPSSQHALMRFKPQPELRHGSIIGGLVHLQVTPRRQLLLVCTQWCSE